MKLRARGEAEKAQRTDAILAAGREIWSRKPWDFTMTDVAERAGIVKGTIYLYFETKEELLAAISERILTGYLDRVDRALQRGSRWTLSNVAALFSDELQLPALPQSQLARGRLAATAERIETRVRGLRRGDGMRFLLCTIAMLSGLRGMNVHGEFRSGVTALARGMEKHR